MAEPEAAPRKTGRIKWRWAGEIVPNFWEPGLIDGLVEQRSMWIMYGASGSGKTAIAVDVAGRVARGMTWRDHAVQRGLVVYIAAENPYSTERRIWAWRKAMDVPESAAPADFPLVVIESPITASETAAEELKAVVNEVSAEAGLPVALVVLDTLARTMEGDENSTRDMSNYVHWADAIKDATGGVVLIIHHTGKDEARGARGSSALKAATDQEWEVFRGSEGARGVKMSKMREGSEEGRVYGFKLEQKSLGLNALGTMVTTVIAEPGPAPAAAAAGKLAQHGALAQAYVRGQGGRATLEELKQELGQISTGKANSEGRAWKRLVATYLRALPGGYVGLPADGEG